jgi:hypothetical protein
MLARHLPVVGQPQDGGAGKGDTFAAKLALMAEISA